MHSPRVILALLVVAALGSKAAQAQPGLGARGEEGEPNQRQQWLVPSPDPARPARAFLFRPPGAGPVPLAGIAHATTQNVLRRAQMPQRVLPPYGGEGIGCPKARMALSLPRQNSIAR
jgi:hypothetical protein